MTATKLSALQRAQQAAAQIAETAEDMNQATKGGGGGSGRRLPIGTAKARFVGYIELGQHYQTVQGKPKEKPDSMFLMAFALWGRGRAVDEKGQPVVDAETGKPVFADFHNEDGSPAIRWLPYEMNLSRNEKARSYLLFKRMNYKGLAKQFIGLLGEAFLLPCTYEVSKKDASKAYFTMQYTDIKPPFIEDLETGETKTVEVPAAPDDAYTYFLWDNPDQADLLQTFHDLHIEGNWDDGKSKNRFQNKIMSAVNFTDSPLHVALVASGANIELPTLDGSTPGGEKAGVPGVPDVPDVPAAPADVAVPDIPDVPDVPEAP